MDMRKQKILEALSKFSCQRAGLEFGNYGNIKSFRSEQRSITRDLHDVRRLMSAVTWRDSITADDIIEASRSAYSGRLTIEENEAGEIRIEYCTGQYFPTEYRKAICAVLAYALWYHVRGHCMPEPTKDDDGYEEYDGMPAGDWLHRYFQRDLGRSIAQRYGR